MSEITRLFIVKAQQFALLSAICSGIAVASTSDAEPVMSLYSSYSLVPGGETGPDWDDIFVRKFENNSWTSANRSEFFSILDATLDESFDTKTLKVLTNNADTPGQRNMVLVRIADRGYWLPADISKGTYKNFWEGSSLPSDVYGVPLFVMAYHDPIPEPTTLLLALLALVAAPLRVRCG